MFQLKTTPFHERTSKLCLPQNGHKWAGHLTCGFPDPFIESDIKVQAV